jgi:hypothetical protein
MNQGDWHELSVSRSGYITGTSAQVAFEYMNGALEWVHITTPGCFECESGGVELHFKPHEWHALAKAVAARLEQDSKRGA